jgi:protein-S-isoprenylcysteine O-methyltransferase Ste14
MKRHERYVKEMLEKNINRDELLELIAYHDKQIQWMQHERLAHLVTMLFVCLFFLLSLAFTMANLSLPCIILSALLMILAVAYIIHYYRLENGVQRWYVLSNKIKLNHLMPGQRRLDSGSSPE